jgi:uncharacterized protein
MNTEPRDEVAPTADRLAVIDVLRGFALLGMILVHFHDHTGEGLDDWVRTAVWRLAEGKSHGTFALLFGAGFALQSERAARAHAPFAATWLRRLAVLAAFGFAAHACFGFNVLLGYAIWGAPLLLLRRASTRTLACIAGAAMVVGSMFWRLVEGGLLPEPDQAAREHVYAVLHAAEQQGSYATLLEARLHHMAWFYQQPFFVLPGATLVLFIAGMLAVRHRVFEQPRAHTRTLAAFAIFGVVAWAKATWLPTEIPTFGVLRDQWLTFTWVAGALLLAGRWPRLVAALRPIGTAGRMAFTNYLLQIAVLDVMFSGYALHVPELRPLAGLLATALLFTGLAVFSRIWLARHRHGPAEWLWRSLTYRRAQPWRQPAPRIPLATARGSS